MACFLVPMAVAIFTTAFAKKFSPKMHINWLNWMLWGGVLMLAVEHLAHEEIVPYFPFLTAGFEEILPELLTVGLPMALAIIAIWLVMVKLSEKGYLTTLISVEAKA
jgi:hypothetical protein